MIALLSKLEGIWPAWLLYSIGFFILMGPLFFMAFVDSFLKVRKAPKTRVGIWLKTHRDQLSVFSFVWTFLCCALVYIELFIMDPRGTSFSLLDLIVTTGGVMLVTALLSSVFQRRK